ncbi:MAG: endonuclease V [Desulfurococcaceae archaeon]
MVVAIFSVERAMKLQLLLSRRVLEELDAFPPLDFSKIRYVGAFDSSYARSTQCAVIVVYDLANSRVVEKAYSAVRIHVPYIPGLLAFREVPGYMRVLRKIVTVPDVVLVDGHGLSHPRAFGIATHMGLVLGKPSIGVAKSHLYGEIIERGGRKLIHAHGKPVGEVLEHEGALLYVSVGYRVRLEDAVKLVKSLLTEKKRLPIPLQIADEYTKVIKAKYR